MGYINIAQSVLKQRLGQIPYPAFITYFPTMRCNLKCTFCDVWRNQKQFRDEMQLDDIEKVFSKFHRIDAVRISGGEPFLRKDLAEIINIIHKNINPDVIHLTTNGTLVDDIVVCMQKIKQPQKIHIKISIDAIGTRHDEIRGVDGTYDKAVSTIEELVKLRSSFNFNIGINCGIVNKNDINDYRKLKELFTKKNIFVYPVIANKPTNALYSNSKIVSPHDSVKPFGDFTVSAIQDFIDKLLEDATHNTDFKEKVVNKYHLRGLKNRLVFNLDKPNPKCVALTSHIRILPNGDVPVCLYNSTVVGNILEESLTELWFNNNKVTTQRKWVNSCPGCWQSCESVASAIYTGDILKGLL